MDSISQFADIAAMLRGYRGIIYAFVGLTLWGHAPRAQGIPSPSPSPKEQTGHPAQNADRQPKPLAVTVVESPEQADASERREAESKKHDARDLDAQIRAADAAEEQVFPSWLGAVLSGIGTILIVWTLCLTRRANRIALDQYKNGFRPWLIPTAAGRFVNEGAPIQQFVEGETISRAMRIDFTVTIKNLVEMPATITRVFTQTPFAPDSWWDEQECFFVVTKGETVTLAHSGAGEPDLSLNWGFVLRKEVREIGMSDCPPLRIRIHYADPLGTERELAFAFGGKTLFDQRVHRRGGGKFNYDRVIEG